MNIILELRVLYLLVFSYTSIHFAISSESSTTYGEFNLQLDKFDVCKGPKRQDCSVIKTKILNKTNVFYDMVMPQNMKPTKVKIVAMSNGKLLLRMQADNPCNHLFLRPVLQSMLNITDNCVVMKGHYTLDVDIEKIAKTYYHGSFVYGNLTFKALFYNQDCNLSCSVVGVTFLPKDK